MAANHQRKLLNGARVPDYSPREQYRAKKKKLGLPKKGFNAKSHISLEWDGKQKKVVARKEQIGLTWRDLGPFIDSVPHSHDILADVFTIPHEIFELEDLTEVLSFQAWQTHLSEYERNFLMQLLPQGQGAEVAVQALLAGENFHFGNPFLKWGASLCSGDLHPDMVLQQEHCLRVNKKLYFSELQNYHYKMINNLQKLKEECECSMDPEEEVLQKKWRLRKDSGRTDCFHTSEHNLEDNGEATSESCSLVAEEKTYSSDNQNSEMIMGGEFQERIYGKSSMTDKSKMPFLALDDARFGKGDKLHKCNIQHADGAKYMSYLKISKKQHQLVKTMKQSGNSIQSKSLNSVLGDIDTLHVQPYEEFVKEEHKKLQEHWLELANKDLPAAYANWKERESQRREMTKSLEQDMRDKLNYLMEGSENRDCEMLLLVQDDQGARNSEFNLENEERENHETEIEDQDDEVRNQDPNDEDYEDFGSGSPKHQLPQKISSFSGSHDLNLVDINHVDGKSDDASPDVSSYSGSANAADASFHQEAPISSGGDVWSARSITHAYYDSTPSCEHTSNRELPFPHQLSGEQKSQLIDLESVVHDGDAKKDLLQRQPIDGPLNSFPNDNRSGLLQSMFKGPEMLSYHHEQQQTGLDFHLSNNVLMDACQFNEHLHGQPQPSLPLEPGLKRHGEGHMQQNISDDLYREGGGYLIPSQGHVPSADTQEWAGNPLQISAQLQCHMNDDGSITQNWFCGERQVRGDWAGSGGLGVPGPGIGSGADQSLFSVLSQDNQLRSISPFTSMGSTGQFVMPRNYGMVNGLLPATSNPLTQASHPLDYLSTRDASSSLMPDDLGWISLPQNPAIRDEMGKPYLRSWNQ